MLIYLGGLVVIQVLLLVLSPIFKLTWPLSIYYTKFYRPFFLDKERYRWKYYLVPGLYLGLYLFVIIYYHLRVNFMVNPHLYWFEKGLILPIMFTSLPYFGVMTMITKPENSIEHGINSNNRYRFDEILYFPNVSCKTCRKPKPARSKHCSICDKCILLQDHHCIWVNNCIGMGNYKWFYLFIGGNSLTMIYCFTRLLFISIKYKVTSSRAILTMNILCGSFAIICSVFTYLQLDLVSQGITTNEMDKWYTIHEYCRDGKLARSKSGNWFLIDSNNTFYSTNIYDHTRYSPTQYTIINDPTDIQNIYDKGSCWLNFIDICTT
ncbi:hypothetical protein Kpol_1033p16 [Vanderwaltozyma polyspora DSM 70294]|uniref:Palmitoyltransferase n=1 Tax=Vanderwaltozyma polyspora (strain ATCC 22028 / DSM 70294 / BCRC 21397 / CBS 2163 / NBRC 10782 / NRRL Y-8283 / UCD 57-17) TaxID=436907 RepID=A7TJ14_VANPO|nr:uncharacterized protein Kpol_1033p16 [Vanderwaltozyma polyspora DSM 70294]EDO17713.1 hypothetical protein Kpol_1033p16 [Vanderwaltozyma polyspora DSM 70294]